MKKLFTKVLLILIVTSAAVLACSDVADETPYLGLEKEVDLRDVLYDTDQTPPDTGAVIR